MAWIMQQKLLPRWSVGPETNPTRMELHHTRKAYQQSDEKYRRYPGYIVDQGIWLPEDCFAKSAQITRPIKQPPDLINLSGAGMSERMMQCIERLEPGVHQFVPVPVLMRDGSPTPMNYFAFQCGQIASDQIDDAHTTVGRNPEGKVLPVDSYSKGVIAINRRETAGWHFWISSDIYKMRTISDELKQAFQNAKVVGLDYIHLPEVNSASGQKRCQARYG